MTSEQVAPETPAPWRMFLIAGLVVGLHFAVAWVDEDITAQPWRVVAAAALGGLVGAAVAHVVPPRAPRGRARPSNAAVRSSIAGLTGGALILAQRLSGDAMSWLLLGGVAMMVGAATHEWLVRRRVGRSAGGPTSADVMDSGRQDDHSP